MGRPVELPSCSRRIPSTTTGRYNLNGQNGPGSSYSADDDGGSHVMALVHDGDSVHIMLDDKELADVKVP